MKRNTLPNGTQYLWYNGEEKHIVINSYCTSKLMVQENEDTAERDIIRWVVDYGTMNDRIVVTTETKSIHRESEQPPAHIPACHLCITNMPPLPSDIKDEPAGTPTNTVAAEPGVHQQWVAIIKYCDTKTDSLSVYFNEVFCFMQNRMDRLPHDIVCKCCVDFYSAEETSSACKGPPVQHSQHKTNENKRTGLEKGKYDVKDIMTVYS